ncbi:MAG: hypothetical protein ABEK50_09645, partial [bacterium]
RFDCVVLNDLLSFFTRGERANVLDDVKRVMPSEADLIVFEPLVGMRWEPTGLSKPDEEQDRFLRFQSLRRRAHEQAGTRLFERLESLPSWLSDHGFVIASTGGWFQPLRLNDRCWTERQRTDLINLRHQARRDQVDVLRRLLNRTGLWEDDHASFLRNLASDFQQRALRKRKALESDDETGWASFPMLQVRATKSVDSKRGTD